MSTTVDSGDTTAKHKFVVCLAGTIASLTNESVTMRREQEQGSYFYLIQGQ